MLVLNQKITRKPMSQKRPLNDSENCPIDDSNLDKWFLLRPKDAKKQSKETILEVRRPRSLETILLPYYNES
ncbi:MAG: hypothetical protein ACI9VI_002796 [Candidatus Azotimanducaceae bacterium]|jgi:hypothetical protein